MSKQVGACERDPGEDYELKSIVRAVRVRDVSDREQEALRPGVSK